jgi:DNA primase
MTDKHPFLDFKVIKERVRIADVLARYKVTLARVNQTALRGNCPLPSHTSDSKKSFYVNEVKSVWYCHSDSCRTNGQRAGGNIIDFVALMERCSVYAAAKSIDEWFPAGREDGTAKAVAKAQKSPPVSTQTVGQEVAVGAHNKPLTFALKDVNPEHPMIRERGISVGTAERFGVGFFPGKGSMAGRIVFPLHENGNLVGYAGRTTLPVSDSNPKWLFGKGLKKSFLYGLGPIDPAKPVILCESLWGPLWFHKHGSQALSLMGSEMTEEQERCLDPYPIITIALDNDPAGEERAAKIRERLKGKHRILKARLIG